MNPVTITFRYLPGEYLRAVNAHQRLRMRIESGSAFSLVMLAGGLAALYFGGAKYFWLGVTFSTIGLAYPVLSAVMLFVVPRLMIGDSPRWRDEYSLTFSHDGITWRTEWVDARINWSLYTSATVVRDFYLLYRGRRAPSSQNASSKTLPTCRPSTRCCSRTCRRLNVKGDQRAFPA